MRNTRRIINRTIVEITLMIVICIISFVVFNTHKLEGVVEHVTYTDLNVLQSQNGIGINEFTNDAQIKLTISNESNTSEAYKVLLTSKNDLSTVEDYLKVKINDKEYLLKDLKVADNYFLIDSGSMKAGSKDIYLYFAIDYQNESTLADNLNVQFVNDLTI